MTLLARFDRECLAIDLEREELANSATHALGLVLSIVGSIALLVHCADHESLKTQRGCGIYAASLVGVYAASMFSHLFRHARTRRLFRILDQAFIYLLIAGSYTPLAMTYLHGGWLTVLIAAMWGIALLGFFSKILLQHRIEGVGMVAYVVLGWMPILGIKSAWELLPTSACIWFLIGGLCYTAGLPFLIYDSRRPFNHAVWHLMVIAGSSFHYLAIWQCVSASAI